MWYKIAVCSMLLCNAFEKMQNFVIVFSEISIYPAGRSKTV